MAVTHLSAVCQPQEEEAADDDDDDGRGSWLVDRRRYCSFCWLPAVIKRQEEEEEE